MLLVNNKEKKMKKITIAILTALTFSTVQANYLLKIPLEQSQGGGLSNNSIILKTNEIEDDDVSYVPFSGSFGYSSSFDSILLGQKSNLPDLIISGSNPVTTENPEVVEYTLYTSKKILIDNFNVSDTATGAEFEEINLVSQSCLENEVNYICKIKISVGHESAVCGLGIYACSVEIGSEPKITFNGRYLEFN